MTNPTLGIDFGTTTTAAVLSGVGLLKEEGARAVFPSVVAFPPTGEVLVGEAARYRRPIDAANTIFSMKRIIGCKWHADVVREFVAKYPFSLAPDEDQFPRFDTRAGKLTAREVSAKVLARVLRLSANHGDAPSHIVVGVPAEFQVHQRQAVLGAMALAGAAGAVCVTEPLAIARAYLEEDLGSRRRIAIYDLGGGTFDFAVCSVGEGECSVVASGGHAYLGGDDIDQLCADWVCEQVLKEFHWDVRTSPQALSRLLAQCEHAKITLSSMVASRIKLGGIEQNDYLQGREITLERKLLERLIFDLVRRTFVVCDQVLAEAGVAASSISQIFLAGGSSKIPIVQDSVGQYFGKTPRVATAPDELVARGAAIVAAEMATRGKHTQVPRAEERRKDQRIIAALRVDVQLADFSEFQGVFARDVSKGGIFVGMAKPPALGTDLTLRIAVGSEATLEMSGKVVHRVMSAGSEPGHSPGAGIQFHDLAPEAQHQLDNLLAKAESLFGPAKLDAMPPTVQGSIETP